MWRGRPRPRLVFGHFPMIAKRSNRIAQAAVAKAMAPLMLCHVTPKASRDVGLRRAQSSRFAKSGALALGEVTSSDAP